MIIKKRKHIQFNETDHTYTNLLTKEDYPSVTKFIGRFHKKFDADIVATHLIENIPKYRQRFRNVEKQEAILILKKEWDKRRDIGTFIHGILEKHIKQESVFDENRSKNYNNRILQLINAYDSLRIKDKYPNYEHHPEMIVYNDEFKLAGQADLILLNHEKKSIRIFDHKTNQKGITYRAFGNEKMYPPINDLPDCNYIHYGLQLSLYAYFLEKEFGYECSELSLIWVDTNNPYSVNLEVINLDYQIDEIKELLLFSKK